MRYYDLNDTKNSVLEIQRILRNLDYNENSVAKIKPNGIYDENTRDLVISFQKKYGLIPTGIVDNETWDLLHSIDEARKDASEIAKAVHIFPMYESYTIFPNTKDNIVYVIQHMLNEISAEHDDITELAFNGIYDLPTQNAIKSLQRKGLLESNGIIDSKTFNLLIDEYERINSRQG